MGMKASIASWAVLGGGLLIAAAAYLYDLDSIHIPKIGDEVRYVQITRLTAASGALLPLRAEGGIDNTKPPLLFWQGIASTAWGRHWGLWRLRFPIVVYTGLVALLVGWLAARLSADPRTGALAALIYLGSFSTFQHGRPFLTNAPETFFLFAPLVLLLLGEFTWATVVLAGVSLGLASLYKSFLLVVPIGAACAAILWQRHRWRLGTMLRADGVKLVTMGGIGVAIFSLWFLVDPHPERVLAQYVLGENLGKFSGGGYLPGLISGTYPLWRIWLGDFLNMGVYALPLLGLLWVSFRPARRDPRPAEEGRLAPAERELWLYVLAFLIVYSVPRQRQENYLLPTVAALSVLLALRWQQLPMVLVRGALVLVIIGQGLLLRIMLGIPKAIPAVGYASWKVVTAASLLGAALVALTRAGRTRLFLPVAAVGALLTLGIGLSPFNRPFDPAVGGPGLGALAGRTIWFPSTFNRRYERYRFLLPGSEIASYNGRQPSEGMRALAEGKLTAIAYELGEPLPEGHRIYGELLDLRTRLPAADIRAIVLESRFDKLFYRLVVLERSTASWMLPARRE